MWLLFLYKYFDSGTFTENCVRAPLISDTCKVEDIVGVTPSFSVSIGPRLSVKNGHTCIRTYDSTLLCGLLQCKAAF